MHGPCAPPPQCPPPVPSDTPLGEWGGQEALGRLNGAYAEQSTNASGLGDLDDDESVPGITIDDSALGSGGDGDPSILSEVGEVLGNVVIPVTAATAAAAGVVGLSALGMIVKGIVKIMRDVEDSDDRLRRLVDKCLTMRGHLEGLVGKVRDEELERDVKRATRIVTKLEKICVELKEMGTVKKWMKKYRRKQDLKEYEAEFEALYEDIMCKSSLNVRKVLNDDVKPSLDRMEGKVDTLNHIVLQLKLTQSKTESQPKRSRSKSQSLVDAGGSQSKEGRRARSASPAPQNYYAQQQVHVENNAYAQYDSNFGAYQSGARYESWNEQQSVPPPPPSPQMHRYHDRSEQHCYEDDYSGSGYTSQSSADSEYEYDHSRYASNNSSSHSLPGITTIHNYSSSGSFNQKKYDWHMADMHRKMAEADRTMAKAFGGAVFQPGWTPFGDSAARGKPQFGVHPGGYHSNVSVVSSDERRLNASFVSVGDVVVNSVDNSMHNHSSVHFGDSVCVSTYNY